MESLPSGQLGWWHHLLGITSIDMQRGAEVSLGVIDKVLELLPGDNSLSHVITLGAARVLVGKKGYLPKDKHGTSIANVMFSRSTSSYQGIAPGADAYFYSARLSHLPDTDDDQIGVALVANGIQELSEHGCDIISVSAGDMSSPVNYLHKQIKKAKDNGTLCFFGSGNRGNGLLYPAAHNEALSVAALGKRGYAPAGSFEHENYDVPSTVSVSPTHYLWEGSATGPQLKYLAPGSNVLWSYGNDTASAVTGTSWSAPLAASMAAVVLSKYRNQWKNMNRDAKRWDKMVQILNQHCTIMGLSASQLIHGLIHI